MNSVIDASAAASSMKIFNIAGLPWDTSSGLSNLGVGDRSYRKLGFQKIGADSVNVWLTYGLQTSTRPSPKQGSVG
jgi:hypothetical protein